MDKPKFIATLRRIAKELPFGSPMPPRHLSLFRYEDDSVSGKAYFMVNGYYGAFIVELGDNAIGMASAFTYVEDVTIVEKGVGIGGRGYAAQNLDHSEFVAIFIATEPSSGDSYWIAMQDLDSPYLPGQGPSWNLSTDGVLAIRLV